MPMPSLNDRAAELCDALAGDTELLHVEVQTASSGTRLFDCGVSVAGGLEAGRRLAEICMAGLGSVQFVPSAQELTPGMAVVTRTDHPLEACMAAQYAGWQISVGKYFAMGSGPMRSAAAKERLFDTIGCREKPSRAVGVLETSKLPPDEVCSKIAAECGVAPDALTLLAAPTSSLAGAIQVVARSVETALHKLFELGFDLRRVVSGFGTAPLPPASSDDLSAIGRTNDAILYGGEVMLYVRGDDASLQKIGPKVPSAASPDHGQTFAAIFERYHRDFYKIDPALFSPAVVTFSNLDTGRAYRFGHTVPRVIHESFDLRHVGH
ncbi:MAG: methenyltetrahydromethanopterin cyclohydrolase [Planctomycetota bacterium]|nr:MAG: methenyltetrahydromethanopterin cyclohydrolase [Planctomycetota bacterium]